MTASSSTRTPASISTISRQAGKEDRRVEVYGIHVDYNMHTHIYPSTCLPARPPARPPACLPACLPTYLYTYLYKYLYTYLYTYITYIYIYIYIYICILLPCECICWFCSNGVTPRNTANSLERTSTSGSRRKTQQMNQYHSQTIP